MRIDIRFIYPSSKCRNGATRS